MNDTTWMIAAVEVAVALGLTVWCIRAVRAETRRHRKAMADIAASRDAILAEHDAWVTRTHTILNNCVADGTLDPLTAARYRRLAR